MNTAPKTTRRTYLRRSASCAGAIALALVGAIIPISSAQAADGPFDIDGIVVPDTPTPPELTDLYGNVKELGPKNASSTKIGVIQNAATPMLDNTNPNPQVDMRRAWLKTAKDSSDHTWLYFAWERDSNSGSGFIAYEFMQAAAPVACAYDTATDAQLTASCNPWKNRQAGDFMILWDQGGSSTNLVKRIWSGTAPNLTLDAPVALSSAVSQAAYSADGFRGEAAVDLTATIFNGSTACRSFANTIPSTVTGNSDTADYKDTILKQAPAISNCTSTVVTTPKQGDGTAIPSGGLSINNGAVSVKDSAVVGLIGGTATPAGSVEFWLCKVDAPGVCGSGGTPVGSTSLSGASYPATVLSPATNVSAVGRYCWRATFSGDSSNGIPGQSDSSSNECFTVNPVASSLTSAQKWVPNDSVTVSAPAGSGALAGTAYFDLFAGSTCAGTALYSSSAAVAGTSPQAVGTSNTTAQTATGSFSWKVSYDSTNDAQLDIPDSCHETSSLTVTNGGTISSP